MIVKGQSLKASSLLRAIQHRLGPEKKHLAREITKEFRPLFRHLKGGYKACHHIRAGEIILSEKLPGNARPELVQKTWEKQAQIIREKIAEIETKTGKKIWFKIFRHKTETLDGSLNVHIHCLMIGYDPETKQALDFPKKTSFKLAMKIMKEYAPQRFKKARERLLAKKKPGKRPILDRSQAPLWICQKVKARLLEQKKQKEREILTKTSLKEKLEKRKDILAWLEKAEKLAKEREKERAPTWRKKGPEIGL